MGGLSRRLSAVAALAAVLVLDAIITARQWPLSVLGLLDEAAHLSTAWLVLSALLPGRCRALLPWALVGVVLIDVDHVPLYVWGVGTADGAPGRPVTHSLGSVGILLALALPIRRLRTPLHGLALGVLLHLVRDVATGPGVPLLWPLTDTVVSVPSFLYVAVLCLVAPVAALRRGRRGSTAAGARPRAPE